VKTFRLSPPSTPVAAQSLEEMQAAIFHAIADDNDRLEDELAAAMSLQRFDMLDRLIVVDQDGQRHPASLIDLL
jgi:hypothetical protein